MLENDLITRTLGVALSTGGDFAEVFAEDRRTTSGRLDGGKVEQLTSGRERGAGVRVVVGDTTGYAHTADLSEAGLAGRRRGRGRRSPQGGGGGAYVVDLDRAAVSNASATVRSSGPRTWPSRPRSTCSSRPTRPPAPAGTPSRRSPPASATSAGASSSPTPTGLLAEDDVTRLHVHGHGRRLRRHRPADRLPHLRRHDRLRDVRPIDVEDLAAAAAEQAISKLSARPAPVRRAARRARRRRRRRAVPRGVRPRPRGRPRRTRTPRCSGAASATGWRREQVTLVDDGSVAGAVGHLRDRRRGRPRPAHVLIQDGILTDYMWDLVQARKHGRASTGNGRRETYQHLPMVRMTNTFLESHRRRRRPGDDLIGDVEKGVYCKHLGGGQVNTATGDFVFGMNEAYLIEDGKVTEPLRSANLIGNGPAGPARHRRRGRRLRHGLARHVRQGRPGRARRMGIPSLRVSGAHRRRDGQVSDELLELSQKVVGLGPPRRAGRGLRGPLHRPRDQGERAATSSSCPRPPAEGMGIRVVRRRQRGHGLGRLPRPRRSWPTPLADARDNAGFATADEHAGLASARRRRRRPDRPVARRPRRHVHPRQGRVRRRHRAAHPGRPAHPGAAQRGLRRRPRRAGHRHHHRHRRATRRVPGAYAYARPWPARATAPPPAAA